MNRTLDIAGQIVVGFILLAWIVVRLAIGFWTNWR